MNRSKDNHLTVPEGLQSDEGVLSPAKHLPLIGLVVTSLLSIVVSILALRSGTYIIFQNLFYFPIIIACYYYKKTGFIVAIALALIYFMLTAAYTSDSSIIINAIIRVIIFIAIGAIVAGMSAARTRTEEKLMLKAFNESIVQNISNGIVVLNNSWEVFFTNPALQTLLGYTADELKGMPWNSLVPPESQELVEMALDRRKDGIVEHYELVLNRKDGTQVPVHISGSPYRDIQTGGIIGALTAVTDLTEQKEAEVRLKEEFNLRNALLDNIPNCIALILKKDTREIVASNKTGQEIGAVPGKTCFQTSALREDPCPFCLANEMRKSGQLQQIEVEYRGTWYEGIWAPLSNDLYVHYIFDITERKQAEEALKLQARERAAVDTFTYSVSNDLQAPLRRIEGFSEALLEECPDELSDQAQDYLNRITTQVSSMKKLTDALLQLSRVLSREIDREEVDLSALIRSNLEKLQYKEPERQLELIVAPGLIAEGDSELLNLMLAKLLDNAWKFSSRKFSSEVEDAKIEFGSKEQNGRTVYYLKDNGIGFKMSHAEKLFAPFQKLHSGSAYPGIGIGLNLAYRIISRHGGEIWAEGEPGKGACFFFTLP